MFLFRSQERPYLCEETNFVCSILLCHITLCLCFCVSSVNWCTYVVLISQPPFDILIVYACTYVCILNEMVLSTQNVMYVTIKCLLTYLLTNCNRVWGFILFYLFSLNNSNVLWNHTWISAQLSVLCTKITEVYSSAFIYTLFLEDVSSIVRINN